MKWMRIFQAKSNNKIYILVFLTLVILLALVVSLSVNVFSFMFYSDSAYSPEPNRYIKIEDNFSGQLYFNNEMGTTIFSDIIISAIDEAQNTIELAVYSMNNTNIRDALYRATERGVVVNLVFSDKRQIEHDQIFKDLPTNIKRLDIPSDDGSMHHKFLLIDQGYSGAKLFFGSYNFTYIQEKYDPCFLLETTRPEIIMIFGEEFKKIANGHHSLKKLVLNSNPFAALIEYPEGFLEIWFGPQPVKRGLKERMIDLIRESNSNIKLMMWNFTSNDLAIEIAAAAQKKQVRIIADDFNYNSPESAFNFLLSEKIKHNLNDLEIVTDTNRNEEIKNNFNVNNLNSFLHHHLLIIDDQVVVFGTNNWSGNGFYGNDESVIISNINSLVSPFVDVWQFNYEKNK
ncbi:hypothetical protein CVU82_03695 [Candidatus Falkowbacteria bacterium HGW-Falkowbacteria-1]|uniref:phospholipase D n=1 Tax=Candidatus Falkowbacteria bacterium HGW-Falkowbacteria-1 TaxID=2013768 RepID=A0A2N2E8R5_9BACT|nr:MAG: hypothetical protein CVU82_03695 [Candidatus Falkowbacteria bacterium HGW-Falkowbacteria-1]